MLRKYFALNEKKYEQIAGLERECREHDGGGASLYLDNDAAGETGIRPFYFIYKKGKPVAFLSIFVVDKNGAEINAITKLDYRRKGYFTRLLKAALKELKKTDIKQIWLVADGNAKNLKEAAEAVAASVDAKFDYSEYVLLFDKTKEATYYDKGIRLTAPEESFTLRTMHELFPGEYADDDWFAGWQSGGDRELYNFADENGTRIGICSVYKSGVSACIYNFGIAKEYQRKGFGKAALGLLVSGLLKPCDKIILQVSGKNEAAYNLYINNGFMIQEEIDYYILRSEE